MKSGYSLGTLVCSIGGLLTFSTWAQLGIVSSSRSPIWSGGGDSFSPALNQDGRFIAFVSHANNLAANDDLRPYLDVFVRDRLARRTALVSVATSGSGGGDGNSNLPSISSDGRLIAFESVASNLAGPDTNGTMDVFVRDREAGRTILVSMSIHGAGSANGPSSNPALTPNGRWMVFESAASDLVSDDINDIPDIFIHDLWNGLTRLVSAGAQASIPTFRSGRGPFTGKSHTPVVPPDGRFVAFVSTATNLVPGVTNTAGEIYLRDLETDHTMHASAQVTNFFSAKERAIRCARPLLSTRGDYLAYEASAGSVTNPIFLLRFDRGSMSTVLVSSNSSPGSEPQMSADGRFVAYADATNAYVWDAVTGIHKWVGVNLAGKPRPSHPVHTPVLTPDGSKVLFLSAATNLVVSANMPISQVFVRDLVQGATRLVSASLSGRSSRADVDVSLPVISADGRWVAFESESDDIAAADYNVGSDVFVRDLGTDRTILASERDPALSPSTWAGVSSVAGISGDGRVVAFGSREIVLTRRRVNSLAFDTNGLPEVFMRDMAAGVVSPLRIPALTLDRALFVTSHPAISEDGRFVAFVHWPERVWRRDLLTGSSLLVSLSESGEEIQGSRPAISGDGRFVAFESYIAGREDVWLRDVEAGTTQLVSANYAGTAGGNAPSTEPILSPDGRWVLFDSSATDLTAEPTSAGRNLFARDLVRSQTRLVSVAPDRANGTGYAGGAVVSANSRWVAWVGSNHWVSLTDLLARTSTVVCTDCQRPSLSADAQLAAYETLSTFLAPLRRVIVSEMASRTTQLVSVPRAGAEANGDSLEPQLSSDGRYVAFASKASNLVENDTNGLSDVFVRDRLLGVTWIVSLNANGTGPGNSVSSHPLLAADGRTVLFQSFASDLVRGDYNDRRDVFVVRLGSPDSDGDRLDDDWELTYFEDLSRGGEDDSDGDGHTDGQEFLAGTNPTSDDSILRVITVKPLVSGSTTVLWQAVPGRSYRVQYKKSLADCRWSELPIDVTASSAVAAAVDTTPGTGPGRFYRVLRLR